MPSITSREKHLNHNLGRYGARTYEQCAVPICISATGAQRERQGERRRRIIYCAVTDSRYRASTIYRHGACDTHRRLRSTPFDAVALTLRICIIRPSRRCTVRLKSLSKFVSRPLKNHNCDAACYAI